VTKADFTLWEQGLRGRKDCAFRLYPSLNHLFIRGEGKSSPEEYLQPGYVDAEIVEDIARWVTELEPLRQGQVMGRTRGLPRHLRASDE
jgi:hypothetical protein